MCVKPRHSRESCIGRDLHESCRSPFGRLIVVGVGADGPIQVAPTALVFGSRSIEGVLTGSTMDIADTLAFSVLEQIRPMIETVALENAPEACARMMRGEARFRIVLLTGAMPSAAGTASRN